jgi:hypothetical protein
MTDQNGTETERQEANGRLVRNEVITCQSSLVDELLKREVFSYDDIINLYESEEEAKENGHEDPEPQEIYEWWVVSEWMAEELEKQGEPLLKNDFGTWWGRTCTGQAILLDHVIDRIRAELNKRV